MRSVSRLALLRPTPAFVTSSRLAGSQIRFGLSGAQRFYSSEEGAASSTEDNSNKTPEQIKIEELSKEIAACKEDVRKFKDHYARAVADFRNLQEITKKDVQKARDFALQKFAKDLLESVDNFGHALGAFKPEALDASKDLKVLFDGVKLTQNVFEKTLNRHGIEKIDPLGQEFNPNQHEATFEFADPSKTPGTVFHVQQPGFTLNGRVIRPAKVGIVKDPEN